MQEFLEFEIPLLRLLWGKVFNTPVDRNFHRASKSLFSYKYSNLKTISAANSLVISHFTTNFLFGGFLSSSMCDFTRHRSDLVRLKSQGQLNVY